MPAFRIKSKSNTECLRLHDLHTCRKSAKTSKSSQTQVKTFQLETELDTFFQTQQNGERLGVMNFSTYKEGTES